MPNFFSNIPVLSAIPNPLNLFNGDDNQPQSPSRTSTSTSTTSSPTQPTPILEGNGMERTPQQRKSSNTSIVIAGDVDSDSPRSGPSRAAGNVLDGGRPRGLSSVSGVSGVSGDSGGGRRRRVRVETFVLVKPPPTSAKNPLNLQVQLVVNEKKTRPRRGSDAVSKAAVSSGDLSSTPSTPQRQSYEKLDDGDTEKTPIAEPSSGAPTSAASGVRPKRSDSISSTQSSSTASGVSAVSVQGGKRIIPLYNLAVHNVVQPTIVTDAGTDSRVAKFSKRQLDISGVGILEPSEVWLPFVGQAAGSPRPSFDGPRGGRPASMVSNMSALSPATSRADDSKRPSVDGRKESLTPQEDGAKKFFGKIFRKRGSADPLVDRRAMTPTGSAMLAVEQQSSSLQVPSLPSSPAQMPQVHFPNDPPPIAMVGHPTFGLAPNVLTRRMSETTLDPSGAIVGITSDILPSPNQDETVSLLRSARPIGYSWAVRKWAKKNTDGWAAHLVAAAAAGLDLVAGSMPGDGVDDVVFEWVKLRVSPNGPGSEAVLKKHLAAEQLDLRRKQRVGFSPRPSPAASNTSLTLTRRRTENVNAETGASSGQKAKVFRRASVSLTPRRKATTDANVPEVVLPTSSRSSKETSSATSSSGSPISEEEPVPACDVVVDDLAYDSDPEDSETPWQCSVWVKRTGQRQLIATLTPAPHHPKVIGVLRIPAGVKSICLTDVGGPAGSTDGPAPSPATAVTPSANKGEISLNSATFRPTSDVAQRVREEIALTEENIKDVVSVTAMWLVAREEFGGLGAKTKGKK